MKFFLTLTFLISLFGFTLRFALAENVIIKNEVTTHSDTGGNGGSVTKEGSTHSSVTIYQEVNGEVVRSETLKDDDKDGNGSAEVLVSSTFLEQKIQSKTQAVQGEERKTVLSERGEGVAESQTSSVSVVAETRSQSRFLSSFLWVFQWGKRVINWFDF